MKNSFKFYLFIIFITSFVFIGFGQSNFYENTVSASVCEGDSNIIKAGCSVAVGQVVRVTPGITTGVTLDKMGSCYNKFGPSSASGGTIIIDLNDPCNQIAILNPQMDKSKYAYVPFEESSVFTNSKPGIASLASVMEVASRKATDGMLMDRTYYAGQVFKNVPYLKTTFAQNSTDSLNQVTGFVFNIWELSKNVAYLLLLIGSLILGLVIMLGNQALDKDGKIKLSIEQAIPRVVISVILISSSYWIGELIFNTLLSGGIVQGLAAFFVSLILQGNEATSMEPAWYLSMPLVILYMGIISGLLASTAGSMVIPIVVATVVTIWRFLVVNFLIVKNIISVLIYIIVSPIVLVKGVLPTKDSETAFKEYFAKLLYFVIVGFLLNLILYGSKTALILGSQIITGDTGGADSVATIVSDISTSAFAGSNIIANGFIFLFSIVVCVTILGMAKNVETRSQKLANQYVGVKSSSDKKEGK